MPNEWMDLWVETYEGAHGFPPLMDWGRDAKTLQRIVAIYGKQNEAALRWAIKAYHTRTHDWEAIQKEGYPVKLFETRVQGLYFEYQTHMSRDHARKARYRQEATDAATAEIVDLTERIGNGGTK